MHGKAIVSVLLLIMITVVAGCSDPIQTLGGKDRQLQMKAAEVLLNRCQEGKIDRSEAQRIVDILLPRFEAMTRVIRTSGIESASYVPAERILVHELAKQGLISEGDSIALLSCAETPWCQYIPRDPSRVELHGDLFGVSPGTVIRRVIRLVNVDGESCNQEILEFFTCLDGRGGLTWGTQGSVDLQSLPERIISVEMETTWYSVPSELCEPFPTVGKSESELAEYQAVVQSDSADKLCTYSKTATLNESEDWKAYF